MSDMVTVDVRTIFNGVGCPAPFRQTYTVRESGAVIQEGEGIGWLRQRLYRLFPTGTRVVFVDKRGYATPLPELPSDFII